MTNWKYLLVYALLVLGVGTCHLMMPDDRSGMVKVNDTQAVSMQGDTITLTERERTNYNFNLLSVGDTL